MYKHTTATISAYTYDDLETVDVGFRGEATVGRAFWGLVGEHGHEGNGGVD